MSWVLEGCALEAKRYARAVARSALLALVIFGVSTTTAAAFTVADPGFAVSTYASVAGAKGIAFDAAGTLRTNRDGGLAYAGDRLYAVSRSLQQINEITSDGALVRVVTTPSEIACPDGLASWTTDLFVTTCAGIYRIRDVGGAATIDYYSNPGSTPIATHGITISPDGIVFANAGNNIWKVGLVTATLSFGAALTNVSGANGLAALSPPNTSGVPAWRYLFVTTSDGTVRVFDQLGVVAPHAIANAGSGGDHSVIGPDGCLYVTQTASVERIANADGTCDLARALTVTPTIALSGGAPHPYVNATPVTLTAALTNAPAGTLVTFTVTGANPRSASVLMSPLTNRASFTYTGSNVGLDTITARATIAGATIVSNAIDVRWYPPFDASPPEIGFSVSGDGAAVVCPGGTSPDDPLGVYCGWYATSPTVTWTYADPESGIGLASGCDDFTLLADSPPTGTPVTCTVTNGDGVSTHRTVILQALVTAPIVTATAMTADGAPYVAGTPTPLAVTVTFSCAHPAGPWAITGCSGPVTVSSGDGTTVLVNGTGTDLSGKSTVTPFGVVVDQVAPAIAVVATRADGTPYAFGEWSNMAVTLAFACSDPGGVASCPAPVTLGASSSGTSVSATDRAGNTATLVTGSVLIDTTPPTIDAIATTADGAPYPAGTWTARDVTVRFTCVSPDAPIVSCGPDATFTAEGSFSATGVAVDDTGSSTTLAFGPVRIDRTAPASAATVSGDTAPDGAFLFHATVDMSARDLASGVASLFYSAAGAQSVPLTEARGPFATLELDAAGTTVVTFWAVDAAGNAERRQTMAVTIVHKQPTRLVLVSQPILMTGQPVSARLTLADGTTPVAGETVTFTAGAVVRSVITGADGLASADLGLAAGPRQVVIAYAGSERYFPSETRVVEVLVFQRTTFVVWGGNAERPTEALPPGSRVQFWGAKWAKQVAGGDWSGDRGFKGLATSVTGTTWSARSGDTTKPGPIPRYIAVLVTQHATRQGKVTSGDIAAYALLVVDGDPSGRLGDNAYGNVVGLLRP